MGTVSVTTFTSDTETVTRTKLNGLAGNLVTEFNGNIDNVNIKAAAAIANSKLNLAAIAQAMGMSSKVFNYAKGGDVNSTGSMTLGTDGNFFDIAGTTNITSITAKSAATVVFLQFDDVLTVVDGSNLKIDGDFTTATGSVLTLISDGTNWREISRQPESIGQFIDRGDPASFDWTESSGLTLDNAFHTLDSSAKTSVPTGASAVLLRVLVTDNAAGTRIDFKEVGNSNNVNNPAVWSPLANAKIVADVIVKVDSEGDFQYRANTDMDSIEVSIAGWWRD